MRKRRRILLIVLGVLLALLGTAAVIVLPRLDALRCLLAFLEDLPADDHVPPYFERVQDRALLGVDDAWVARPDDDGPHPLMVFVAGIATKGLEDGRILRAVEGFRRGGFVVVAPIVPGLADPGADDPDPECVQRLLARLEGGTLPDTDPSRIGVIGISVGGAYALRICARHLGAGGGGVTAVLAIGAPADVDRCAARWWSTQPLGGKEPETAEDHRRDGAELARSMLWRAAVRNMVPDEKDAATLAAWLKEAWVPEKAPEGLTGPEGRAFAAMVLGGLDNWAAGRTRVTAATRQFTEWLSPIRWSDELAPLAGVPVFLLHGVGDPLVPFTEMEPLADLLRDSTTVTTLESRMLGHEDVKEAGLDDRWAHVLFMDEFFDAVCEEE